MIEQNGYISRNKSWRKKYEEFKHYDIYDDYLSEDIIEENRISYREEFWDYLDENEYWD